MGRTLRSKNELLGGPVEENGADFFAGWLVADNSPVVGNSIEAAGASVGGQEGPVAGSRS